MAATIGQVISDLRERIQGIEAGGQRSDTQYVSTGFEDLDRILGDHGLKRGSLIEWTGVGDSEGSGAGTLALVVAANVLRRDGALVVIDNAREFYLVAAAELGIPLERTAIIRPETRMDALWAWEQALRCPGVAVTFGWIDAIDDRLLRRLQLAVETGGGLGFLLRPPNSRSGASWAATRITVHSLAATRRLCEAERFLHATRWATFAAERSTDSLARRLQVSLTRGETIEVELEHEASDVSLVSELADPAATGG
jgi:protein ImuA